MGENREGKIRQTEEFNELSLLPFLLGEIKGDEG